MMLWPLIADTASTILYSNRQFIGRISSGKGPDPLFGIYKPGL